jgi:hypothetical protein
MTIRITFHQRITSAPEQKMHVILGGHTVKAFVAAPRDVQVIGIVRLGLEFGLLALTPAGNYVRINGSEAQRLNHREVEEAIRKAQLFGRGESFASSRSMELTDTPRPAPTVMQRRHRRIDPELAANNSQLQPLAA